MDNKAFIKDDGHYTSLPDLSMLKKDFSSSTPSFATASSHDTFEKEVIELLQKKIQNDAKFSTIDAVTNRNAYINEALKESHTFLRLQQSNGEIPIQNDVENVNLSGGHLMPRKYNSESHIPLQNSGQNKDLQVLCAAALLQSASKLSTEKCIENNDVQQYSTTLDFKKSENDISVQNIVESETINEQIAFENSFEVVADFSVSEELQIPNNERTVTESLEKCSAVETLAGINEFCLTEVDDTYVSCSSSWGSVNLQHTVESIEVQEEEQQEEQQEEEKYEQEIDMYLPPYLQKVFEGMTVNGDKLNIDHSSTVFPQPQWLNHEKFCRGQEVALRYHFGLVFAEMLSLLMLFSFPDGLSPLVFTGKTDTPFKAFRRYLSTVIRVKSWYEYNPWKPDSKAAYNLCAVRKMHETVRNQLLQTPALELSFRSSVETSSPIGCPCAPVWSPLNEKLQNDFQASCPYPRAGQRPYTDVRRKRIFISQWEMVGTQFAFVSLFVMFPKHFGAHGVTDDELDCFLYTWRVIGYMLGIEDCYNFCNGNLETIRQRCRDFFNFCVKPNFRDVSRDWEHMSRCVMEGVSYYVPKVSFEVSLLYLSDLLNINTPRLKASLTFRQKYNYYVIYFVYYYLCRIPGMLRLLNWLLDIAIKRAQNFSQERLLHLERKIYPYQTT